MPIPAPVPAYRELPRVGALSQRSGWGVFGDDDVLGRISLATPERYLAATQELLSGQPVSLNWRIDSPSPTVPGRQPPVHHPIRVFDGWDDYLDAFYPQASSQWDSLSHCRHPELGYYNGIESPDEFTGGQTVRRTLGIHNFAQRGIAARFVLLDVQSYAAENGIAWSPTASIPIDRDLMGAILDAQQVDVRTGDILLLRTGWISWYESSSESERMLFPDGDLAAPGLSLEESTLEWLWDNGIAGMASDTPWLEQAPFDTARADRFLHYQLIPLLGFLIGELFDLDALADRCRQLGKWDGALTAAPMNLVGGVGSPANALAFV